MKKELFVVIPTKVEDLLLKYLYTDKGFLDKLGMTKK